MYGYFVSVLSRLPPRGEVSALSYSLLLDLIAAAWLSLRDLDLGREIAPHVVVGCLVAVADAVGQQRRRGAVGGGTAVTVMVHRTVLPVVPVGSDRATVTAGSTAVLQFRFFGC